MTGERWSPQARARARTAPAWGLGVLWAAWALVRLFGLETGFPLVPLLSYTPYAVVGAAATAGLALALRRPGAGAVAATAALVLLALVLPRLVPDAGTGGHRGPSLRIVSANIHENGGELAALFDLVVERRADVLSVQELTPRAARRLDRLGIGRLLPHRVLSLEAGEGGAGIYSRRPLRRLPEAPYPFRMPRARTAIGGRTLEIVCVHPQPPRRGMMASWEEGLRTLPSGGAGPLRILAGDFNATLDHAELRAVLDRGYRDAAAATGEGLDPTWPSGRFPLPPITIDHVLADERAGIEDFSVHELPGSDHRMLYAELALGPS